MYKAEYDIMITYNCKTPTVLSVYMLRDKEYALMFFEFSFYAYGFPQIASYVYKGTRLPGEKDVYTYIGSDPNVYGHTLSQYTRIK